MDFIFTKLSSFLYPMKSWKIGLRSAATDKVQEMMQGCEMRKIKNWSHDLTESNANSMLTVGTAITWLYGRKIT